MNEIAVMGDLGSVIGFRGIGFTVIPVEPDTDQPGELRRLAESGRFAVIYLTEEVAKICEAVLRDFRDAYLPAIIPIPSSMGSSGYGLINAQSAVRKAVGFDVLSVMEENEGMARREGGQQVPDDVDYGSGEETY